MKKALSVLLCLAMMLTMTSCGVSKPAYDFTTPEFANQFWMDVLFELQWNFRQPVDSAEEISDYKLLEFVGNQIYYLQDDIQTGQDISGNPRQIIPLEKMRRYVKRYFGIENYTPSTELVRSQYDPDKQELYTQTFPKLNRAEDMSSFAKMMQMDHIEQSGSTFTAIVKENGDLPYTRYFTFDGSDPENPVFLRMTSDAYDRDSMTGQARLIDSRLFYGTAAINGSLAGVLLYADRDVALDLTLLDETKGSIKAFYRQELHRDQTVREYLQRVSANGEEFVVVTTLGYTRYDAGLKPIETKTFAQLWPKASGCWSADISNDFRLLCYADAAGVHLVDLSAQKSVLAVKHERHDELRYEEISVFGNPTFMENGKSVTVVNDLYETTGGFCRINVEKAFTGKSSAFSWLISREECFDYASFRKLSEDQFLYQGESTQIRRISDNSVKAEVENGMVTNGKSYARLTSQQAEDGSTSYSLWYADYGSSETKSGFGVTLGYPGGVQLVGLTDSGNALLMVRGNLWLVPVKQ